MRCEYTHRIILPPGKNGGSSNDLKPFLGAMVSSFLLCTANKSIRISVGFVQHPLETLNPKPDYQLASFSFLQICRRSDCSRLGAHNRKPAEDTSSTPKRQRWHRQRGTHGKTPICSHTMVSPSEVWAFPSLSEVVIPSATKCFQGQNIKYI